ncbi:MAG: branched-chain amino acid ABC transporter permease [Mesorhizobium sp.]|uniref:branched-chain amino acid ABC transporter permease n=1 Tax=Mesorhizobium sp. TaxID=1871066 RepID=UPI000FE4FB9E|nr:branched-chain amino acid ABC transporter permease [Mesorhizobium sp.]RWC16715.1 MAG: branched-chain amino acid ABC transporter permease [Mesorhizobium sp.]
MSISPGQSGSPWWHLALKAGAVCGFTGVYIVGVGVFSAFGARSVLAHAVSLGQLLLLAVAFTGGWYAVSNRQLKPFERWLASAGTGLLAGLSYAAVLLVARGANVQGLFVAFNQPTLSAALLGQSGAGAIAALAGLASVTALAGAAIRQCPSAVRRTILAAAVAVLFGALLRDLWVSLFSTLLRGRWWVSTIYVSSGGLTWVGAGIAVLAGVAWQIAHYLIGQRRTPMIDVVILMVAALLVPFLTNAFVAQVMLLVGLYALMGMGLNIELGLAGLLDLGFVAFFAIGAYATALLTSDSPLALAHLSFWEALPVATLCAAAGGFIFGLPVLRVRGDYLALATLGLGEIVRIIVVSDMAAPAIGGAQGIVGIPRPKLIDHPMVSQLSLYYLTFALACLVAFAAWRLQHSPVGRAWTAARDDEDVAATLGLDLVRSKLRAYVLGAAFAGVAGALFATTLGSVFPQSLRLDVSINVLALLVIGGLGSLPGVFVGSFILIGLPEFLREFGEYRYLFYGFVLILVMRVRPQGLWPAPLSARHG